MRYAGGFNDKSKSEEGDPILRKLRRANSDTANRHSSRSRAKRRATVTLPRTTIEQKEEGPCGN